MLRVGIVGFGFMGRMHYTCWKAAADAQIAAVCDANPNIVEDTNRAVGHIEAAESGIDLRGIPLYRDLDAMLAKAKLDAISLALPTHLHPDCTVKALEAGVHVLCEKPMALSVADCRRMIDAAEKTGKVLQIGHCVRFWPEYAKAKEITDGGRYGKVVAATFQRLGAAPTWSEDNWFLDEQRSGGMVLDLHIHDTDYVQYLLGMPKAVCSHTAASPNGAALHVVTQYIYRADKVVTAEGGWAMMPGFGFEMSFNIALEKATLVYDLTREPMFKVCPAEGDPFTPEVASGDGYSRQTEHFIKTIKGEKTEQVTTLEQSLNSVRIVEAEKESASTGRRVEL